MTRDLEPGRFFHFVEVGTSDFRTLVQFLAGTDTTCPIGHALRTWNPDEAVGLVVELVRLLLERLPNLRGVQKVPAAMGAADGWGYFWCVRDDARKRLPHAYSAWLARGTGTLGKPHPQLKDWIVEEGIKLSDVMTRQHVPVLSFKTLVLRYNIREIDVLKLDCEGADCEILSGLMDYCDKCPATFPRIIAFETNKLSCQETVKSTISLLEQRHYEVISQGDNTILKRRPQNWGMSPSVCCAFLRGQCLWGERCFFDHGSNQDTPRECCFGSECVYGHGGVKPRCCKCRATTESRSCYCKGCWSGWRSSAVNRARGRWLHLTAGGG